MTLTQLAFLFFAALILSGAWIVVTARNLVHAALCLALCFLGTAGIFALLDASFLVVVAVVIGAGGISVLVIFAVMLTRGAGIRDAPFTNRWPLALVICLLFFGGLISLILSVHWPNVTVPITQDTVSALGNALLDPNQYLLPFELASVLLLAALIGAVFIASRK